MIWKGYQDRYRRRGRDQIKSALTWKFTESEVENALKRMERLKSLINYALTGTYCEYELASRLGFY